MDRRQAALALLAEALGAGAADAASAQGYYLVPLAPPEAEEAAETGRVGLLSLRASRIAQARASSPGVETAEQTTLAQILTDVTGAPAPPLTYAQQTSLISSTA